MTVVARGIWWYQNSDCISDNNVWHEGALNESGDNDEQVGFEMGDCQTRGKDMCSILLWSVQDYLLQLDRYFKLTKHGNTYRVIIFTDESYVNLNHAQVEILSTNM